MGASVVDPAEYAADMPVVAEQLRRFERCVAAVRSTHSGQPEPVVREALDAAFRAEGIKVQRFIAEDVARQIAGEG